MAGLLSILSALGFAAAGITIRRGVIKVVDAFSGIWVSVPIGVPFFLIILLVMGRFNSLFAFSGQGYFWLALGGIVHLIIGRGLNYNCIQHCGANLAQVITGIYPLITVVLSVVLLHEPLSWGLGIGTLLIVGGVAVGGLDPQALRKGLFAKIPRQALIYGIGASLGWGVSPIFVKWGLQGSSGGAAGIAGAAVSYTATTVVLCFFLLRQDKRKALTGMAGRAAIFFSLAGLFGNTAQLLRYVALGMAPASVVTPLNSVVPIFQVMLAFLINRKLEVFNWAIILGTIAVVIGSILIL